VPNDNRNEAISPEQEENQKTTDSLSDSIHANIHRHNSFI